MREEHNRQVQKDIDLERAEIKRLRDGKDKYIPEITKLENRLTEINDDMRRADILIECGERKIATLSDRFWSLNNHGQKEEGSNE